MPGKKSLGNYWWMIDLRTRDLTERTFYSVVNLPVIGNIYHSVYTFWIRRRARHSLNEMEIETYNVCNLKCLMCPYPSMTRAKERMDMELFQKIVDDAVHSGIRRVGLNFYSEPLLDPLLFERIKYAKRQGLKVEFYSNGTLLTKDKIDGILNSGLDTIIFSFDGATKETYESIRVGANFEETRDNILHLLRERKARDLKKPIVVVYMVAQKSNYREIKDFKSFWQKLADQVWTGKVDARKTREVLPERSDSGKVKLKRLYPCKSIFKRLEIMSNGKVALCPFDYDGSVTLGDLSKQTINELWNSKKFKAIRELHLRGQGKRMKLCHNTGCEALCWGAYCWWRWQQF